MIRLESECQTLCYKAARLKEPYCRSCGQADREIHRVILKSHGDWKVQCDSDFRIGLCAEHHRGARNAPHVSPERFNREVLPRLLNGMDPARAAKIAAYMSSPSVPQREKPDFKEIRAKLRAEIAKLEKEDFDDADIRQNRRWKHG